MGWYSKWCTGGWHPLTHWLCRSRLCECAIHADHRDRAIMNRTNGWGYDGDIRDEEFAGRLVSPALPAWR